MHVRLAAVHQAAPRPRLQGEVLDRRGIAPTQRVSSPHSAHTAQAPYSAHSASQQKPPTTRHAHARSASPPVLPLPALPSVALGPFLPIRRPHSARYSASRLKPPLLCHLLLPPLHASAAASSLSTPPPPAAAAASATCAGPPCPALLRPQWPWPRRTWPVVNRVRHDCC
jgi:hypothetical protein